MIDKALKRPATVWASIFTTFYQKQIYLHHINIIRGKLKFCVAKVMDLPPFTELLNSADVNAWEYPIKRPTLHLLEDYCALIGKHQLILGKFL
jgi:hypothetical protein